MADEEQAAKPAQKWLDRLADYKKRIEDGWATQRENLDKLYSRDERSDAADRQYAIFWANIEVLKPAVYARPPQPVVAPRFKDGNPVARAASETLERCLTTTFEMADIDAVMRDVRDELLRYGRGTAWVRLAGNDDRIAFDYVPAEDFAHAVARSWSEVSWIARRAWLTKDRGTERFGPAFEGVPMKKRDTNSAAPDPEDKAPVWEIWDRETGQIYWVAEDHETVLDAKPAMLDLSSFWPCPKPAYGTLVPKRLKPVPDIRQYTDQIEEINEYTARIASLSQALRARGFYPAGAGELGEAIESALKSIDDRAILIPVSSFGALGPGGFRDSIVWLPVVEIAQTIKELIGLRQQVIDDVYQITGISDIVRGSTVASETATAQQIKSQWGSLRIRERQNELARFARDLTRIAGEIIAENFAPEVILQMSQSALPDAQMRQQAESAVMQAQQQGQEPPKEAIEVMNKPPIEAVLSFLKDDRARGFVIEIETDSTIQPDEDAEKQRRTEFVTAVGTLFQQAAPIVMQAPQLGPFLGEVLKFVAAGFRAGRPLEAAIDQLVDQMDKMAAPKGPDPMQEVQLAKEQASVEKLKAEAAKTGAEAQAVPMKAQAEQAKVMATMQHQARAQEMEQQGMAHSQAMDVAGRQDAAEERAMAQQEAEAPEPPEPPEQDVQGMLEAALKQIAGLIQESEQRTEARMSALVQQMAGGAA